jgi:fibro-slime domain-containing protein
VRRGHRARTISIAVLVVHTLGCGARTELEVEDCAVDAGARACETACGAGEQVCVDGRWQRCVVPPATRACTNACGAGTQSCIDEVWLGCEVPVSERACTTACGEGTELCVDGRWGRCSADRPLPPVLTVFVRDFHDTHPDFEASVFGDDRGIVEAALGPDDKPVYGGPTPTTHGREAFDEWYRDVSGVNAGTPIELTLTPSPLDPTLFVHDDLTFFPIDRMLFGNEGRMHNFHFTLEARTEFVYRGGETFRFRGDDDVFVYVDRRLVIDLGGVHGTEEATVSLDSLGLTLGERYPIHLFFAERHTTESTFTVETTVADAIRCE